MNMTRDFIYLGRSLVALTAVSFVVGCDGGGGFGAVITPIDGQWLSESGVSIDFDDSFANTRFFNRSYELSATLNDSTDPCDLGTSLGDSVQFEVVYDQGIVQFYVGDPDNDELCLNGIFTNLVTLQVDTAQGERFDVFNNSRIEVRLDLGMWVSAENNVEMRFFEPSTVDNNDTRDVAGCVRFNGSEVSGVTGTLSGYDTVEQRNPIIRPLFSESTGEEIFSSITFVDVLTLSAVQANGAKFTLERVEELQQPFCEDPGLDIL